MAQETDDEQVARDLQLAYELQAQQDQEESIQHQLAFATNDIASTTNILGGGTRSPAPSSGGSASPFSRLGEMFNGTASRNRNNDSLLGDGSSNMQSNSSLLYVPCEIKGRMVELMVDSGSQTSVISSR